MKFMKTAILVSLGTALAALAINVQAQLLPTDDDQSVTPEFEEVDTNSDGVISMEEAKESWIAENFRAVDVNQDGYISKTEYSQAKS